MMGIELRPSKDRRMMGRHEVSVSSRVCIAAASMSQAPTASRNASSTTPVISAAALVGHKTHAPPPPPPPPAMSHDCRLLDSQVAVSLRQGGGGEVNIRVVPDELEHLLDELGHAASDTGRC